MEQELEKVLADSLAHEKSLFQSSYKIYGYAKSGDDNVVLLSVTRNDVSSGYLKLYGRNEIDKIILLLEEARTRVREE